MVKLYKLLIALTVIFAVGHIVYTFADEALPGAVFRVWFFSASLGLLFNSMLNLLHLKLGLQQTKTWSFTSNAILFLFTVVLAVIVPEVQVFCLVGITGLTVFAGLRVS